MLRAGALRACTGGLARRAHHVRSPATCTQLQTPAAGAAAGLLATSHRDRAAAAPAVPAAGSTFPALSSAASAAMEQHPVLLTAHAASDQERQALQEQLQREEFPSSVHFSWGDGSPLPHAAHQQPGGPPPVPPELAPSSFNGPLFLSHLSSQSVGRVLLTTAEISSTQDFLRAHQSKLPAGVLLTAERQVAGRGRGGNQWTSPKGCLMFTASRPLSIQGTQAPFINYVVCLGVLRGIADAVAATWPGLPPLGIRIKWPNDIYAVPVPGRALLTAPLKIGGALMHTTWSGGRFNLLAGIGLNVHNREPTTCLQALMEDAAAAAPPQGPPPQLAPEVLLARVASHLDDCLRVFEAQGFAPLEADYLAAWLHSGQRVLCDEEHASTQQVAGGQRAADDIWGEVGPSGQVELTIEGLSPSGFLLAVDHASGRRYELTPDGNSLDMMSGLLRKKLPN